jgi:hypothetical protein
MATKPKLELTWIGKENRPKIEPRVRVEFHDDALEVDSPDRAVEADLDICGGPRCPCLNVLFRWLPAPSSRTATAPPREFWLDLNDLSIPLSPEQTTDAKLARLAEIVRGELTEEDRRRLREWYLAGKLDLILNTPVAHIGIEDLPNADRGEMIGFVDVFPCGGLALNFRHNGEVWAVDEQYCVQPDCRCSETVLSFFRLMDAAGRKTEIIRQAPTLRYNYLSRATEPLERPAGMPSPQELLAVIKGDQPDVNHQLHRRHLIMQLLYARRYQAQAQARRKSLATVAASAPLSKIGRNAPCPCGSGRKYKHCCLNKAPS